MMEHKGIVVFESKHVRRVWHNEKWHFSVVDVCGALTGSDNPRNYWNMLKAREKRQSEIQLSTLCVQLKLTSADGKSYKTDCADAEGFKGTIWKRNRQNELGSLPLN